MSGSWTRPSADLPRARPIRPEPEKIRWKSGAVPLTSPVSALSAALYPSLAKPSSGPLP